MEIIKKIARWILREEISELIKHHEESQEKLKKEFEISKEILNERFEKSEAFFKNEIAKLTTKLNGRQIIMLSQTMVRMITEMLPDANQVSTANLTSQELITRSKTFKDSLRGRSFEHKITFVEILESDKKITGVVLNISDYNIDVTIPLERDKVKFKHFNTDTEIDTYYWDFYKAGIRIVSDIAWNMVMEFITAQRNVLSELKQEGLL